MLCVKPYNMFCKIFVVPFWEMWDLPDIFVQTLWEGLVGGTLYSLIALGFVLIFKASGVFNFAQGILVVFGALTLVGLNASGVSPVLSWLVVVGGIVAIASIAVWWLAVRNAAGEEKSGRANLSAALFVVAIAAIAIGIFDPFRRYTGLNLADARLLRFIMLGAGIAVLWFGMLWLLAQRRAHSTHFSLDTESGNLKRLLMIAAGGVAVGLFSYAVLGQPLPAFIALALTVAVMFLLAFGIERIVLRPLVNQPDIILFMATFGITFFLIGLGELIFGGDPKVMITKQLYIPTGTVSFDLGGGRVELQKLDITAAVVAALMVGTLAIFFSKTRIGRALRAVADSHKAALSVGISLNQIWVIVWFAAGLVALVTGIMWGARSEVSFALEIVALKALPVLILGGFTSIPGAIVGGLIIGVGEKVGEIYWGPLFGRGIESWLAYMIALVFLLFRPQGLFGEKIIERV